MISTMIVLFLALIVIFRALCLAAHLSYRKMRAHPFRCAGIAATNASCAAGALAIVMHHPIGGPLLLIGLAGTVLFDRRRPFR